MRIQITSFLKRLLPEVLAKTNVSSSLNPELECNITNVNNETAESTSSTTLIENINPENKMDFSLDIQKTIDSSENSLRQLMEISLGIEEIAEFSKTTTKLSKNAVSTSQQVKDFALAGEDNFTHIISYFNEVMHSGEQLCDYIDSLSSSIKRIFSISQIINSIAREIKMISINAAIEAARVGDVGAGFAVVAEQIKRLSDETNSATEEIVSMVSDNKDVVSKSKEASGNVRKIVDMGEDIKINMVKSFSEIVTGVTEINNKISNMDKAVMKQAKKIDEIHGSVESVSGVYVEINDELLSFKEKVSLLSAQIEKAIAENQVLLLNAQNDEKKKKINSSSSL